MTGHGRDLGRGVIKPILSELMADPGTGLDYEIRPDQMPGYLTPLDRFFVRNHAPTPVIDASGWRLRIDGEGVREPVTYTYRDLWDLPLTSVVRTIECAGNRRVFFGHACRRSFAGTQSGPGAIGTAEWTGVRLRDVLSPAGIGPNARQVMPEGLDGPGRRPMPVTKALADDTLLALAMNGDVLPPDHGFPARVVVSGWLGAASIKWVGRIVVSNEDLYVPWNTDDYTLLGPDYPPTGDSPGVPITDMPVASLVELPLPARMRPGRQVIRGRAYAGHPRIQQVACGVDDGPWQDATLLPPIERATWVRWQFVWDATPGDHELRVRATDELGRTQPHAVSWNDLGYLYNAVTVHPIRVVSG
jgi:DMSO/TMAO reductase YedYZ molybdopterin-dependent catalytic subunit